MNTEGSRDESELNLITERILGAAYQVSNELGCGFLEKLYENALVIELRNRGLMVKQQVAMEVSYSGVVVGNYVADMLVEDCVLVELKAVSAFDVTHFAQCLNYLRATGLPVCLLLNFGRPKLGIKRFSL